MIFDHMHRDWITQAYGVCSGCIYAACSLPDKSGRNKRMLKRIVQYVFARIEAICHEKHRCPISPLKSKRSATITAR